MWFLIENQQVTLRIFAKPNAKKTRLITINSQGLNLSLHAKPQEGAANQELIAYLAKLFKLPKSCVELKRGEMSRHKYVRLPLTATLQQFLDDPENFIRHLT